MPEHFAAPQYEPDNPEGTMTGPFAATARELIGPKPKGSVRTVSLAVRGYLRNHRPQGLVLAVSGGADSLALAVAALDLAERAQIPTLTVTVDHGIRPRSREESEGVAELLTGLGAGEAQVASGKLHPGGAGPEGDARALRYRELFAATRAFQKRHNLGPVELLLGHTLDDQAETVLLRLARGASSASLGAMRKRMPLPPDHSSLGRAEERIWLGRPLLRVRRTQTEAFCAALGLRAVQDPTNMPDGPWRSADGSPLRRSAVRQWVLPLLSRVMTQDVAPALARVADQLQEDERALAIWVDDVLKRSTADLPQHALCRVDSLQSAPAAIRRRALRSLLLGQGVPGGSLTENHLLAAEALVCQWHGQGPVSLPGGVSVGRQGRFLFASHR